MRDTQDDRPVAFVVHHEPLVRQQIIRRLTTEGYRVEACPGPMGGTDCPLRHGCVATPCLRLPDEPALVVIDANSITELALPYRVWLPDAEIRVAPLS